MGGSSGARSWVGRLVPVVGMAVVLGAFFISSRVTTSSGVPKQADPKATVPTRAASTTTAATGQGRIDAPVVVSLTWDDGRSSQIGTLAIQAQRGFVATYYVNSTMIGSSGWYLTKAQLDRVAAQPGNEVGGHTRRHEHLPALDAAARRATVCGDRTQLMSWYGKDAGRSFAYPYGESDPATRRTVEACGYESGRGFGDADGDATCPACSDIETVPPRRSFDLASPDPVTDKTTLAGLKARVRAAEERGGGWVVFTFHSLGRSNDEYMIDPLLYGRFLDWLQTRTDVAVRTVGDVISRGAG